jgi:hypothetical protein
MKPRRWYSSPELNPEPTLPGVQVSPSRIYLVYASRAHREQGPIIKQQLAPATPTPQHPVVRRPPRRIEAA